MDEATLHSHSARCILRSEVSSPHAGFPHHLPVLLLSLTPSLQDLHPQKLRSHTEALPEVLHPALSDQEATENKVHSRTDTG